MKIEYRIHVSREEFMDLINNAVEDKYRYSSRRPDGEVVAFAPNDKKDGYVLFMGEPDEAPAKPEAVTEIEPLPQTA